MVLKIEIVGRSGKLGSVIAQAIRCDADFTEDLPADVIIDVSHPDNFEMKEAPMIVGSTGHSEENFEQMQIMARSYPVMYAPNFSFGMTLLKNLALNVKEHVQAKIDVTEVHHEQKQDAPSGTAIHLANLLGAGAINAYRRPHAAGEHSIYFAWGDEELEIRHKSHSRKPYADGALKAAKWIANQKPGFYGMDDICKM